MLLILGSTAETLIRLFTVVDTSWERFSRNRAGIFRAVMKSPKLIFISLKRRTFPLITSLISSDSELYRIGKMCLAKMLHEILVILKHER